MVRANGGAFCLLWHLRRMRAPYTLCSKQIFVIHLPQLGSNIVADFVVVADWPLSSIAHSDCTSVRRTMSDWQSFRHKIYCCPTIWWLYVPLANNLKCLVDSVDFRRNLCSLRWHFVALNCVVCCEFRWRLTSDMIAAMLGLFFVLVVVVTDSQCVTSLLGLCRCCQHELTFPWPKKFQGMHMQSIQGDLQLNYCTNYLFFIRK